MRLSPERAYVLEFVATVAALALLLHTPLLDPLAMSARDQYARLASGREALDALAALEDRPEREAVRANVGAVRHATSYWDWRRRQERGLSVERTRILTPDGTR